MPEAREIGIHWHTKRHKGLGKRGTIKRKKSRKTGEKEPRGDEEEQECQERGKNEGRSLGDANERGREEETLFECFG